MTILRVGLPSAEGVLTGGSDGCGVGVTGFSVGVTGAKVGMSVSAVFGFGVGNLVGEVAGGGVPLSGLGDGGGMAGGRPPSGEGVATGGVGPGPPPSGAGVGTRPGLVGLLPRRVGLGVGFHLCREGSGDGFRSRFPVL